MIRLTIQRKVFFASFALTATMALLLVGLTRWNLEQGFSRYVARAELGRLDWLANNIEDAYAQNGSWDFLRARNEVWNRLSTPDGPNPLRLNRRPPFADDDRGPPADTQRPPRPGRPLRPYGGQPPPHPEDAPPGNEQLPPRGDPLGIHPRISLVDAAGVVLAGDPQTDALTASRPLRYRGEIIGAVRVRPPRKEDALATTFLETQSRDLWLSGLAALALALVAAWLLARQFLAPIRDLAAGARAIAAGRFMQRIPERQSDELGELAADFNSMADMLARTEESRRQWISDSSHELRTPLAVMRAEIEALQDGVRTSDGRTLERLHRQIMQMSKLVDDLGRTLERGGEQSDLELASLSPLAVLREAIDEFRKRFVSANIALDTAALPEKDFGWRVRGDADRLHQVFANLLENTLRYTHAGGRLRITATGRAATLQLRFDDSAPAPPTAALPRLFDRFFRAEPSRSRQHGGSGLGLAICKTIIEGHGGTIGASKSELGGLCVTLSLPLEN